jgi:hypothetical protein
MAFADFVDARKVLAVLGKRLSRYGLTLHPDKTRFIDFRCGSACKKGSSALSVQHGDGDREKGHIRKTSPSSCDLSCFQIRCYRWSRPV